MNARGREVLRAAALRGVPQAHGVLEFGRARCAVGVLIDGLAGADFLERAVELYQLTTVFPRCPECSRTRDSEIELIAHLNDDHAMDFLGIAAKCPDSEPSERSLYECTRP